MLGRLSKAKVQNLVDPRCCSRSLYLPSRVQLFHVETLLRWTPPLASWTPTLRYDASLSWTVTAVLNSSACTQPFP